VTGTFPVADKQLRGGWLCQDPGPGIWLPPGITRLSGKHARHGRCGSCHRPPAAAHRTAAHCTARSAATHCRR